MRKSSINIKPVTFGSEMHNTREVVPKYVKDFGLKNENKYIETNDNLSLNIHKRLEEIKEIVKEKTGRTMQSKATPIREALVVLQEHHTMEHLEKLAKAIQEKYIIKPFQIHIHRDEGTNKDNINYHAHIVIDYTDHNTGKSIKLKRQDIIDLQTLTADILGMERGNFNSKAERLEHGEYRKVMQELNLKTQELELKLEEVEKKKENTENMLQSYKKLETLNQQYQERSKIFYQLQEKLKSLEKSKEFQNSIDRINFSLSPTQQQEQTKPTIQEEVKKPIQEEIKTITHTPPVQPIPQQEEAKQEQPKEKKKQKGWSM